jgi:hypothetical protein
MFRFSQGKFQSSIGFQPVRHEECAAERFLISGDSGLSGTCGRCEPNARRYGLETLFYIQGSGLNAHLSHSARDPSREAYRGFGVAKTNQFSGVLVLIVPSPLRPFALSPVRRKRLIMLAAGLLAITVYARNHILNLAPYDPRILKMAKVLGG